MNKGVESQNREPFQEFVRLTPRSEGQRVLLSAELAKSMIREKGRGTVTVGPWSAMLSKEPGILEAMESHGSNMLSLTLQKDGSG